MIRSNPGTDEGRVDAVNAGANNGNGDIDKENGAEWLGAARVV